jgi:DNA topoisomerase II
MLTIGSESLIPMVGVIKIPMADPSYDKLSDREHVLLRPTNYVGPLEPEEDRYWIVEGGKMVTANLRISRGLITIIGEILVNAADEHRRQPLSTISVNVTRESITIADDGRGIPIRREPKHDNMWLPEMIFTQFRAGGNFDDANRAKDTGGVYGIGAKATVVLSKWFTIDTRHGGSRYVQSVTDNLTVVNPPDITRVSAAEHGTTISFSPDFHRFGLERFDEAHLSVIERMCYDLAATTGATVAINRTKPPRSFASYAAMYGAKTIVQLNDKWIAAFGPNENGRDNRISFVNSVFVPHGGTHIAFLNKMVVRAFREGKFGDKYKDMNTTVLQNSYFMVLTCSVNLPEFTGAQKSDLTTKATAFGTISTDVDLTAPQISALTKCGMLAVLDEKVMAKDIEALRKEEVKRERGISFNPKYYGASLAGDYRRAKDTILILVEGDSAKGGAIAARSVLGVDRIGVFPIRGKVTNAIKSLTKAEQGEICADLKAIIGIKAGIVPKSPRELRYDHILIMSDQDSDGLHIRGLVLVLINSVAPYIREFKNYIGYVTTPLVIADGKEFYSLESFRSVGGAPRRVKYFKGIGTLEDSDLKRIFKTIDSRISYFSFDDKADESLELAFGKESEPRKDWLRAFIRYELSRGPEVPVSQFIHHDLIQFSMDSNIRAIPGYCGLKEVQRKIIAHMLRHGGSKSEKLPSLSGAVTSTMEYVHGPFALMDSIVTLAQRHVGTNNLPLLVPEGQYGNRVSDAASSRYLFTKMQKYTRLIFNKDDDAILHYVEEEGKKLEPWYFLPIVPIALINGVVGIGTAFASDIPCHNPVTVINNISHWLNGEPLEPFVPWYHDYTGDIVRRDDGKFKSVGNYRLDGDVLTITELPVGRSVDSYHEFLAELARPDELDGKRTGIRADIESGGRIIADIKKLSTDLNVHIKVILTPGAGARFDEKKLVQYFQLEAPIKSNITMFDDKQVIQRFATAEDMFMYWVRRRLDYYEIRRLTLILSLRSEVKKLMNQVRFLTMVVKDEIDIRRRKRDAIIADLRRLAFDEARFRADDEKVLGDDIIVRAKSDAGYGYLIRMPIDDLTDEEISRLEELLRRTRAELERLAKIKPQRMWLDDLERLVAAIWDKSAADDE